MVTEGMAIGARWHAIRLALPRPLRCPLARARSRAVAGRRGALAHLRADGESNWRDGGGQVVGALRGCVDIDISATLLANTLRNNI